MPFDLSDKPIFSLESENLGSLDVRDFISPVQSELSDILKAKSDLNPLEVIRFLGLITLYHPTEQGLKSDPFCEERKITPDESWKLTEEELNRFAEQYIQNSRSLLDEHFTETVKDKETGARKIIIKSRRKEMPKDDTESWVEYLHRILLWKDKRQEDQYKKLIESVTSANIIPRSLMEQVRLIDKHKHFDHLFDQYKSYEMFARHQIPDLSYLEKSLEFKKRLEEDHRRLEEAMRSVSMVNLPALEHTWATTESIRAAMESIGSSRDLWQSALEGLSACKIDLPRSLITISELERSLSQTLRLATLSERSLTEIQWDCLKWTLNIEDGLRQRLQGDLATFSSAYENFFRSIELKETASLQAYIALREYPSVEFHCTTELFRVGSRETITRQDEEVIRESLLGFVDDEELPRYLEQLNSELLNLLNGSREALRSKNPDRVRHFAVSLRELFTHVLHKLAPDEAVKGWVADKALLDDKGRPTRKARLLFLCQELKGTTIEPLVEKDVSLSLNFLNVFQVGTHKLAHSFSELELDLMQFKMENLIRFMFIITRNMNCLS